MIPNHVFPPEEENITLGKWSMLHKDYLLKHNPVEAAIMTAEGRFWQHLAGIDKQATEMFDTLIEQIKKGITEQLKADSQMEWVRRMQIIEARIREVVCEEINI